MGGFYGSSNSIKISQTFPTKQDMENETSLLIGSFILVQDTKTIYQKQATINDKGKDIATYVEMGDFITTNEWDALVKRIDQLEYDVKILQNKLNNSAQG